jgi:hypothetical protein
LETPKMTASAAVYSVSDGPHSRLRAHRQIVSAPEGDWVEAVQDRLDRLVKLPRGWDGYGGHPVRFENAHFALQLLTSIWPGNMPAPQIVPGAGGDLQIEWHGRLTTIELHIRAPNDVTASRETLANPDGEELHLSNNFIEVSRWVRELQGETGAAVPAAA